MKQESMKVLFFIRKSRLKKNGEAPIFLRVTINGQLDEIRIQRSVPLKLWDNVKERSKGKDRRLYRGIESKAVPDSQGTSLSGSPDYPKESSDKVVLKRGTASGFADHAEMY